MDIDTQHFNNYDYAISKYEYYQAQGGWDRIPLTGLIEIGDDGEIVLKVKKRLKRTGDFTGEMTTNFGKPLEEAVKSYQKRNTIASDGIVGPETARTMNVTVEERLGQLRDAQRAWELTNIGFPKHFIVNIGSFEAWAMEQSNIKLKSKAIVGRMGRRTTIFHDRVEYVTFSPSWHVPYSIATRDILPKLQKDPTYAIKNNLVITMAGAVVDPLMVEWENYARGYFPFRIRQNPGIRNALGKLKIMFPNKYNTYMHDTPAKELFNSHKRMFSSGCIRLEKPDEFAHFALEYSGWTIGQVQAEMEIDRTKKVRLSRENYIPVDVVYLMSWVDEEGVIHFTPDYYRKGKSLTSRSDK